MMEDDVVKVIRLRNQPEAARKLAPKWRRALDMVEWVSAQLPDNSQFQVYGFNMKARAVLADTHGKWLDSNDPRAINNVLTAARNIVPGGRHQPRECVHRRCAPSIRSPTRSS